MGIGSVTSTNNISNMRMFTAGSSEPRNKSIQNEIINVQQQMQSLSTKEELSVNEKMNERKKLQNELASLNTELKQHQQELRRSQNREIMMAKLRKDSEPATDETAKDKTQADEASPDQADEKRLPADEQQKQQGTVILQNRDGVVILKDGLSPDTPNKTEAEAPRTEDAKENEAAEKTPDTADNDTKERTGLSHREIQAMVSADSSLQQAGGLGTVISRTSDGIAILKGEIKQDEMRDTDTGRKQAELKKMEKAQLQAISFQGSLLGEANGAMQSAAGSGATGKQDAPQVSAEKNAFFNAVKASQEAQTSQQRFYVSFFE